MCPIPAVDRANSRISGAAIRLNLNNDQDISAMTKFIPVRRFQEDQRVFIDMPEHADNPCTACGACCTTFRVSFYCGELTGGSGGFVPAELSSKVNDFVVCMKGTETGGGACIALQGTPGQAGIRCSIYPDRPTTCREFSAWLEDGSPNPDCQRVRAKFGLLPLFPLLPMGE